MIKKTKTRPWALAGGLEPAPNAMVVNAGTPAEKRVGTYRLAVAPGDVALCLTGGGGGFGAPEARDPAMVLEDVLEGYVSPEAALRVYKVAITDGAVDQAATRALRAAA